LVDTTVRRRTVQAEGYPSSIVTPSRHASRLAVETRNEQVVVVGVDLANRRDDGESYGTGVGETFACGVFDCWRFGQNALPLIATASHSRLALRARRVSVASPDGRNSR
jgi:hypothetical protein